MLDFSLQAAKLALEDADIKADEIDLIICATIQGDYITPSFACVIQKELGAKCPAFDINAACSGFIYALDVATGYFERNKAKNILVVAAEGMSKFLDWTDRSTCVLFGDGAGAAVLSKGDGLLSIKISANGNSDALKIDGATGNCPYSEKKDKYQFLSMNGQEVYKFAVSALYNDIKEVIAAAGLTEADIDFVLPHQANIRIIETAKSKLGIAPEKYRSNIDKYGNTSSASIPILLDELNKAGEFKKGDILALSAFGGGFTTAACIIKWCK
jgi:3-oxoacyl-[acyl-carrier-protein] synthase-3